jgi:geranylgeranyl diphosphate synthase type II
VELIHCYSLVHDDLPAMDDDDLRRGRPTCHRVYGEALAVLAGDALLTFAFQLIAQRGGCQTLIARSVAELATAAGAAGMVGGQVDDLAAEGSAIGSGNVYATLRSIHERKTGHLLRACARLGAIAAAAGSDAAAAMDEFGEQLGLLFQITDDLLDEAGQESHVGKRVGKDQHRGKLTYPAVLGIEPSRRVADEVFGRALRSLDPVGCAAEPLRDLARFILERDR